jgi:hypothetical protein
MATRGAVAVAAVAAVGVTLATVHGTATAAPPSVAGVQAVQVQQLTLRLASDPSQVANVAGAATGNGANVIQWPWSGQNNERWEAESTLDGYYRLMSVNSGRCLNVAGGGSADGAPAIQYTCGNAPNELWKFAPVGNGYQIVSKGSDKCLNVRGGIGKGKPLIQYTCTPGGATNDVWLPVWEQ